MLILRRKSGESIVIGEDIRVTVLDINEGSVRLAIDAPKVIPILRSELLQAADANRDSAVTERAQSHDLLRFLGGKPGTESHPKAVRPGAAKRLPRAILPVKPTRSAETPESVTPSQSATPENVPPRQGATPESVTPSQIVTPENVTPSQIVTPENVTPTRSAETPESVTPTKTASDAPSTDSAT